MRKKIITLTSLCLCAGIMFAGCGNGEPYSGIEPSDYVKVGQYKEIKIKPTKIKVTDQEVSSRIDQILSSNSTTTDITTGIIKNGDTVKIDYVGKINGKKFKGGTGKDQSLTIGSNQFIKGFESSLVGVKIGDTKTLNLTFPKDYDKKLAGKKVAFKVTVKSKQETKKPKLDEKFVASQIKEIKDKNVKTVKDYKKYIKSQIKTEKEKQNKETQKQKLWTKVVSTSELKKDKEGKEKYPENEVKRIIKNTTEQYKTYAKQNKMKFKTFIKKQMGVDEKTFNKQVKEFAQNTVKDDLIVKYIADKEKIDVDDKDCDKFVKNQLAQYGMNEEQFKQQNGKSYKETVGEETVQMQTLKNKVLNFVLKKAKK